MEIYNVSVSSFDSIERTDFGYRYGISEIDYKMILAIQYNEYMIDINTGEKFYVLKRSSNGIICKEEFDKIELNTLYALSSIPVKKSNQDIITILKAYKQKFAKNIKQKSLKR